MTSDKEISFKYENLSGEINDFKVLFIKHSETHFEGRDLQANKYKTFRKTSVIEYYNGSDQLLGTIPKYISPRANISSSYNKEGLFEVCFTGFKKVDKDRLIQRAKDKNLYVVTKVTVNLGILVCGYNAGPSKIKQAISSSNTVEIMDEDEFLHFLDTGAVPR